MGSKTLKKGKRVGLTRNQRRKIDYATQAAQNRRVTQVSSQTATPEIKGTRLRKIVRPWKHLVKKARYEEALLRQQEREKRSVQEQLSLISKRPGFSKRETIRLQALLS